MLASRRHVVRTIFRLRTNERLLTNSVGGIWCVTIVFCSHRLFFGGVEDVAPYNEWGDLVRRHGVLFSPFGFRGDQWSPLQKQQDLVDACRGDQ